MEGKKHRIGWGMFFLILVVAILFDVATFFLPFAGDLIAPIYWGAFSWYLFKTGHGLLNWKTGIAEGLSLLGEMIPVVQALPTICTATAVIFFISRLEDKTGLSITQIAGKVKNPMAKRLEPFYKDGVRQPRKAPKPEPEPEEDFSTDFDDAEMAS
jgi:hypothetical protein